MWNGLARPVLTAVIPPKAGMTSHDISSRLQYPSVHNANGRPLGRPFCFCEIWRFSLTEFLRQQLIDQPRIGLAF
jgi:hypothetical protein